MTNFSRRRIGGAVIAASLSGALVFGAPMAFADPPEPGQNQFQGPGDNQGPPEPGQNQFQGPGKQPPPNGKKGKRKPPPPPWWGS